MKRITYVSHLAISDSAEIEEIGAIASQNNQKNNITGVLICFGGLFFQIIEGEVEIITRLYQ